MRNTLLVVMSLCVVMLLSGGCAAQSGYHYSEAYTDPVRYHRIEENVTIYDVPFGTAYVRTGSSSFGPRSSRYVYSHDYGSRSSSYGGALRRSEGPFYGQVRLGYRDHTYQSSRASYDDRSGIRRTHEWGTRVTVGGSARVGYESGLNRRIRSGYRDHWSK